MFSLLNIWKYFLVAKGGARGQLTGIFAISVLLECRFHLSISKPTLESRSEEERFLPETASYVLTAPAHSKEGHEEMQFIKRTQMVESSRIGRPEQYRGGLEDSPNTSSMEELTCAKASLLIKMRWSTTVFRLHYTIWKSWSCKEVYLLWRNAFWRFYRKVWKLKPIDTKLM